MVNCTLAVGAASARPISGNDGRYISMESGPSAVSAANNKVSANVPGRSISFLSLPLLQLVNAC
jgi:hypothetical protein